MPDKPAHGQPCNGCGMCCAREICVLGYHVFGFWDGPCPALGERDGKMTCGLAENPRRHAPVRAAVKGQSVLREAALALIGAGLGCDANEDGEPYDEDFGDFLSEMRERYRPHYNAAFEAWGCNKAAIGRSYRRWRLEKRGGAAAHG